MSSRIFESSALISTPALKSICSKRSLTGTWMNQSVNVFQRFVEQVARFFLMLPRGSSAFMPRGL